MGKRQRYSEFIGVSDEEVQRVADDPKTPERSRQKAITELKFRGLRNRRRRSR